MAPLPPQFAKGSDADAVSARVPGKKKPKLVQKAALLALAARLQGARGA